MIILKNWSVGYKLSDGKEKMYLKGKVYGHPSFNMGDKISTSSLDCMVVKKDFITAKTTNGSIYMAFRDDIDIEILKSNPNFYNHMIEHARVFKSQH